MIYLANWKDLKMQRGAKFDVIFSRLKLNIDIFLI